MPLTLFCRNFFRLRLPLAACGKHCGSIRHVLLIYYANAFNCNALYVSTNALTHVVAIKATKIMCVCVCLTNAHMRHALLQCALMKLVIILQLLAYVCGMQSTLQTQQQQQQLATARFRHATPHSATPHSALR